jgi:hypothetical protein
VCRFSDVPRCAVSKQISDLIDNDRHRAYIKSPIDIATTK